MKTRYSEKFKLKSDAAQKKYAKVEANDPD